MFVPEALVAILKSFDPGGAMLNLGLSLPVNMACWAEEARRGSQYSHSALLVMQEENNTTGQHANYIRWLEEIGVIHLCHFQPSSTVSMAQPRSSN